MLNKLSFLIVLFCGISMCFSQKYHVLYKVSFRPKKENADMKTEYMRLETIAKSQSIFYKDSVSNLKQKEIPYLRFIITQKDNNYSYYGKFNDLYYVYNEPLERSWKIINKTSMYNDYKVQEAQIEIDGRKWIAQFAPEIPITSGPYKFSGLPGLILKIYSEDGDYSFEMVELTKYSSESYLSLFQTSRYTKLKKKKVETFIANFLKDPGSQNFKLVNSYGDQFDYKFSGKRDNSYKDMNEYVKGVFEKYNNPIDKKIYILIF